MKQLNRVKYLRDVNKKPYGVFVSVFEDDKLKFGWSLCHKDDRFLKQKALELACIRRKCFADIHFDDVPMSIVNEYYLWCTDQQGRTKSQQPKQQKIKQQPKQQKIKQQHKTDIKITKKDFVTTINTIKEIVDVNEQLSNLLGSSCFIDNTSKLIANTLSCLALLTNDKDDFIDWYCWDKEFGKKDLNVTVKGKVVKTTTPEELYDFLIYWSWAE